MTELTTSQINDWADCKDGPVALHLRQALLPVEGKGSVIFPPTYAYKAENVHYNIDELSDGTKIATIDSVGSQANRMESIFIEDPLSGLVPQIKIEYEDKNKKEKSVSLLKAGHRLGDAIIRSTELKDDVRKAFLAFADCNDASSLAKIGPTSLVFGIWDSRDTLVKIPRVVQSTIRAEDVSELRRSAQYNPPIDYAVTGAFRETAVSDAERKPVGDKNPLAKYGYVHVPAVNDHGGVIANGPIRRDVTINLIAVRRLEGSNGKVRRYVLGLALVAATEPLDGFLRAGCLLTEDPGQDSSWECIDRKGSREPIPLDNKIALAYAQEAAEAFGVGEDRTVAFDKDLAKDDVERKTKA